MLESANIRREPGRPTPSDGDLMGHRDRLVWLLSVSWGDIGWQLSRASNSEQLHEALAPVRGRPGEDVIAIFVHPTSAYASGKEIRKLRKELDEAADRMQAAYQEQSACANSLGVAEAAIKMNQVKDADTELELDPRLNEKQRNAMVSQFRKRQAASRSADSAVVDCCSTERNLRNELKDKEAAFAQAELLDYIAKAQYARNPLSLANAMAGLPDLGWSQSYARCSKINCLGWPTIWYSEFEIIERIWKKREGFSESPIVELFQLEVQKLPRKKLLYYAPEAKKIWMPNQVRSRLADNFRLLRLAIEEALQAKMHPGRTPFAITSLFEKNMDKPRPADEALLIAHERIE